MRREKGSAREVLHNLKMEITSSQNTLLIAVDTGKVKGYACFVSSSGKCLDEGFSHWYVAHLKGGTDA